LEERYDPKYYPKEVVDFFCKHHSKEHILDGIASGNMGVLMDGDVIVGMGCFNINHITGVYVLPCYQKQGCGTQIMDCLENEIFQNHNIAILDASLPAVFYMSIEVIKLALLRHEMLPTAELIRCMEKGKTQLKDSNDLMDCLYREGDCEKMI